MQLLHLLLLFLLQLNDLRLFEYLPIEPDLVLIHEHLAHPGLSIVRARSFLVDLPLNKPLVLPEVVLALLHFKLLLALVSRRLVQHLPHVGLRLLHLQLVLPLFLDHLVAQASLHFLEASLHSLLPLILILFILLLFILQVLFKLLGVDALLLLNLFADGVSHELHAPGYFGSACIPLGLSAGILCLLLALAFLLPLYILHLFFLQLLLSYSLHLSILVENFRSL